MKKELCVFNAVFHCDGKSIPLSRCMNKFMSVRMWGN